jgi:4-amino-4-deoxy-L-arabinose transferase-like glycosyltransferase
MLLETSRASWRASRLFRSPYLAMVLTALGIRLVVMLFLYPDQLAPGRDHWNFAYETGRIARSIVLGQGFSNPLFSNTGPTAFMTPVYPYLLAGVFKVLGVFSLSSAIFMLSLNSLLSAVTCIPIAMIARRCFGDRVAVWSGWVWALFPYAIYFPVERIWATWLSTLLLSILFLMALRLEHSTKIGLWIGFGLLWGLTALNEPVVLSVLPALLGWACYRLRQKGRRWLLPAATSVAMLLLVVAPWFVRNYQTFHRFVPFRDTLGLEFMIGNNGDSFHWRPPVAGPWHNSAEWLEFQRLGELGYMDQQKRIAFAFIRTHPAWFAWMSVRRATYLWTGFWSFDRRYLAEEPLDPPNIVFCTSVTILALFGLYRAYKFDRAIAALFAMTLFFYPLVYYVTHPEVYYRRQIDPMIVILAVYAIVPRSQFAEEPEFRDQAELMEMGAETVEPELVNEAGTTRSVGFPPGLASPLG